MVILSRIRQREEYDGGAYPTKTWWCVNDNVAVVIEPGWGVAVAPFGVSLRYKHCRERDKEENLMCHEDDKDINIVA